jgi:hypothetical protein
MTGFPSICVVVRSGVSQLPWWTRGSDAGIYRVTFGSHTHPLPFSYPQGLLCLTPPGRDALTDFVGDGDRTALPYSACQNLLQPLDHTPVSIDGRETLELVCLNLRLLCDAISTVTCRFYAMPDSYITGLIT